MTFDEASPETTADEVRPTDEEIGRHQVEQMAAARGDDLWKARHWLGAVLGPWVVTGESLGEDGDPVFALVDESGRVEHLKPYRVSELAKEARRSGLPVVLRPA